MKHLIPWPIAFAFLLFSCGKLKEKDQSIPKLPVREVSGTGIDAIWSYWIDANAIQSFPTPIAVTNARVTFVGSREFFVQESASGQGVHFFSSLGANTAPQGVGTLPTVGDVVSFSALKWSTFRGERQVTEVSNWTTGENRQIDDLIVEGDSIDWSADGMSQLGKIIRVTAQLQDSPCLSAGTAAVNWTLHTQAYSGDSFIMRRTCDANALAWVKGLCVKIVSNVSVYSSNGITTFQLQHLALDEDVTVIECPSYFK